MQQQNLFIYSHPLGSKETNKNIMLKQYLLSIQDGTLEQKCAIKVAVDLVIRQKVTQSLTC